MEMKAVQLAKLLGVTKQAVYAWLKDGCPYYTKRRGLREELWVTYEVALEWIGDREVGKRGKDKRKRKPGTGKRG